MTHSHREPPSGRGPATSREPGAPIGAELDTRFGEGDVHRIWLGVQERIAVRRRGRGARRPLALLLLAASVSCVVGYWLFVGSSAWMAREPRGETYLATLDGRRPRDFNVPAEGHAERVDFTDGSAVELAPASRLEVLTNGEASFVTSLRRGSGTFDVKPGGPRRWVIECGVATVEVIGTRFRVDRGAAEVRISVERGKVRVRGEGFERLLGAGESTTVSGPPQSATPPVESADARAGGALAAEAKAGEAPSPATTTSAPAIPGVASVGNPAKASGDPWDALLQAADAARRRGDRATAVAQLDRVAREAPDPERRELARYTVARLALDEDPARAAAELDRALAGALPRGLGEDALARLVEAHARAGELAAARTRAREYEAKYPTGRHLDEVRYWVEGH